jgi:hypothetical protein
MTTEICHQPVKLHDIAWGRSAVMKYIITVAVAFFVVASDGASAALGGVRS